MTEREKKYRAHNALGIFVTRMQEAGRTLNDLTDFMNGDREMAHYVLFCAAESARIIVCRRHRTRGRKVA